MSEFQQGSTAVDLNGTTTTHPTPVGSRKRLQIWVVVLLTLLTVVIGGLRFARADLAGTSFFATDEYYTLTTDGGAHLEHLNIDIVSYLAMIEDRRGVEGAFYKMVPYPEFGASDGVLMGPVAPFIHRPALPFIASLLPFDSGESFALVNLVLVVVGLWFLLDALAVQGRTRRAQLIGGLLYSISLPVLVFSSALYIDGGAMAIMVIGYWLVARRLWWAIALFFPLSYAFKEAIVFLAPTAVVAWWVTGRSFKDRTFVIGAALSGAGWVAVAVLVRAIAPDPTFTFSLGPKLSYFGGNLGNMKSSAFFIVGCAPIMVPAAICAVRLIRSGGLVAALHRAGPELVGLAMFVLVNIYSMASTDLTLRTAWLFWPFGIALTAMLVDDIGEQAGWRDLLDIRGLLGARRPA